MSAPLDEDAPRLARTAVRVVDVLNDATAQSVGYPGLAGPRDTEAVLGALARLADELTQTVSQLDGYLTDRLRTERLVPAPRSARPPAAAVDAACSALAEVREAAGRMADLLTTAELALLEVKGVDEH